MYCSERENSSEDELPAPGDYRTGCPEGGNHAGGVVDIRHTCGLCIMVVGLFRTTFVFEINSSWYCSSTGQFIVLAVRRGDGSMFGMLGGCGRATDTVLLIYVFF